MIQTIITHRCPQCGSEQMVKNGHDYRGAQKYHCQNCGGYDTLDAQSGYDERTRAQVKHAVLDRLSLRGIERLFGISPRTVADRIKIGPSACPLWRTPWTKRAWMTRWNWMNCGPWCLRKITNAGYGWPCVATPGRWWSISSGIAAKPVVCNSGDVFQRRRCVATRSASSGTSISAFLTGDAINQSARKADRPTILSAGSIPCASARLVLFAKPCLFPNPTRAMR